MLELSDTAHIGELIGTVIAATLATLGTLQAWLKIQQKREGGNPHNTTLGGTVRRADLRAALLEHERSLAKLIGDEGHATRREMREGFKELTTAIREAG